MAFSLSSKAKKFLKADSQFEAKSCKMCDHYEITKSPRPTDRHI